MVKVCEEFFEKGFQGTRSPGFYMDGNLKNTLDIAKKEVKNDWDMVFVIDGEEGCLTGDTIINVNRCSLGRRYALKHMYKQYHNGVKDKSKLWNLSIPTYVRSYDGTSIRLHKIRDVVYSGKKIVYMVRLENGKKIKATKDHKIMTKKGWVELRNLVSGNEVMCDTLRPQRGKQRSFKLRDVLVKVVHHPYPSAKEKGHNRVEVHRLIYEARLNNLSFNDYLDTIWNDSSEAARLEFVNPSEFHVHHKDGCHFNNSVENLELISVKDHLLLHAKKGEAFRNFNQGVPVYSKVITKEHVGIEKTYDIVCEDPHHNFVANGMVVHNSGKSVLAQQLAFFCDPTFDLNDIVFRPEQFRERVADVKRFKAIIFDEAYSGLSSRSTMTKVNKAIVDMLTEIRQKNLFLFIVLPTYFDLDKYVAIWRSRGLVNVYHDKFKRGYFKFYNSKKKKLMYMQGKKLYSYSIKCNFFGRFPNFYTVDETEYKDKKNQYFRALQKDETKPKFTQASMRKKVFENIIPRMIRFGTDKHGINKQDVAEMLNIDVKTLRTYENAGF